MQNKIFATTFVLAACLLPLVAQAQQSRAWIGVAAGIASLPPESGLDPAFGRRHSMLTLGVAPEKWRAEVRGDLLWAHWPSYAGPVSLSLNALLPVGSARFSRQPGALLLQPYLLAGVGIYGVGNGRSDAGANAGFGVRIEGERLAVFTEARRHTAYARNLLTFGVGYRP